MLSLLISYLYYMYYMIESVNLTLLKIELFCRFEPMCMYYGADQSFMSSSQYPHCLGYHKLWDCTDYNQLSFCLCVDYILYVPCRGVGRHSCLGCHRSLTGIICMVKSNSFGEIIKSGGSIASLAPHFSHLWYALTKMCVSSIESINFGKDNLLCMLAQFCPACYLSGCMVLLMMQQHYVICAIHCHIMSCDLCNI